MTFPPDLLLKTSKVQALKQLLEKDYKSERTSRFNRGLATAWHGFVHGFIGMED